MTNLRFDLADLRLFLEVAQAGSITAGARRANLALASASERLHNMEEALGVALFTRGRRGVAVTPAGQALLLHARAITEQIERMNADLGQYAQGLKGRVRLLCNTSSLNEFLPEALSAFMTTHPQVDVELEELTSVRIVRAVLAGEGDIGLLADSTDLRTLADAVKQGRMQIFPLRADRLVVVTAPAHSLARRRGIAFAEALDHDFIGLTKGISLGEHLAAHAPLGKRVKARVRLGSFEAVCRMVERGLGISVMPEVAVIRCQKTMNIRRIPLSDEWATRRLTLCVRKLEELPAYARQLVEHLRPAAKVRGVK